MLDGEKIWNIFNTEWNFEISEKNYFKIFVLILYNLAYHISSSGDLSP